MASIHLDARGDPDKIKPDKTIDTRREAECIYDKTNHSLFYLQYDKTPAKDNGAVLRIIDNGTVRLKNHHS